MRLTAMGIVMPKTVLTHEDHRPGPQFSRYLQCGKLLTIPESFLRAISQLQMRH